MIVCGLGASVLSVAKLANCDGPLWVWVAPTSTLRWLKPWPARLAASAIRPARRREEVGGDERELVAAAADDQRRRL